MSEPKFSEGLIFSFENNEYSVTGYEGADTDVVIPGTFNGYPVKSIGDRAFYGCDSLTSVTIPDSVTSIGEYAFKHCESLTSITVEEGNTSYRSRDGNLYSKDEKTLIQYAMGKSAQSFTIPDSVTSIGEKAFDSCKYLTSVTIGNGVTSIYEGAFHCCNSLTSVTIPDSVTSIGFFAFGGCASLTSVTFANPNGWILKDDNFETTASIKSTDLSDPSTAAKYLKSTYRSYYWKRS